MHHKVDFEEIFEDLAFESAYEALLEDVECIFEEETEVVSGWQFTPVVYGQVRPQWLNIKSAERLEEVVAAFEKLSPHVTDIQEWADENMVAFGPSEVKSFLELLEKPQIAFNKAVASELRDQELVDLLWDQATETYRYKLGGAEGRALVERRFPKGFVQRAAQSEVDGMRRLVAASRVTPPDVVNALLGDADPAVAQAARANPASEADPRDLLADYHHHVSKSDFLEFYEFYEDEFATLLSHPRFPFDALLGAPVPEDQKLALLAGSDLEPLRLYVACLPQTPLDVKLELARRMADEEGDRRVKVKLALRSRSTPEVLQVLMQDPHSNIRRLAAGQYLTVRLFQKDFLQSYAPLIWAWGEELGTLQYELQDIIPAIYDMSRQILLRFEGRPYGFQVDDAGNAAVQVKVSYGGRAYDPDDEDPEFDDFERLTTAYGWQLDAVFERAVGDHKITFALKDAFSTEALIGSATQFDERIVAALIAHNQLEEAMRLWTSDWIFNYDAWWAALRPLRVMGQYAPHIRETFEQALLSSDDYLKCLGFGLKTGFGTPWDNQPVTRMELTEALRLAKRAKRRGLVKGFEALLATVEDCATAED